MFPASIFETPHESQDEKIAHSPKKDEVEIIKSDNEDDDVRMDEEEQSQLQKGEN